MKVFHCAILLKYLVEWACALRIDNKRQGLVGSRYIGDYYMILELQYMYYIPLTTLLSGLFINIKHVKLTGPETKRA